MSKARYTGLGLSIALLAGCEVGEAPDRSEPAEKPASPEIAKQSTEVPATRIDSPEAARQAAARTGIREKYTEVIQRNTEGEPIRVYVPEVDPVIEVPEGSACGGKDAQGRYLSCAPGTFCMKASETSPTGSCQAAPRAPRFDG